MAGRRHRIVSAVALLIVGTAFLLLSSGCEGPKAGDSPATSQGQPATPCPNCTPTASSDRGAQAATAGTARPKPVLGKAAAEDPDPSKLVNSKAWGEVPANHVGILLKDGRTRKDAEKVATDLDGTLVAEVEFIQLYTVQTKGGSEADLVAALDKAGKMAEVEVAFPNTRVYSKEIKGSPCSLLRDPLYQKGQNGRAYEMIGMEQAWKYIRASGVPLNDVRVGVIDEALNSDSEETGGKVKISGFGEDDVTDQPVKNAKGNMVHGGLTHGTQVTHIIAADPDNGGATGVAGPLGSKLNVTVTNAYTSQKEYTETAPDANDPAKLVYSGNGKSYLVKSFAQMVQQIEAGATVINWSRGPEKPSPDNQFRAQIYRKFLDSMHKKYPHVVFVAAAGNEKGGLDGKNYDIGGQKLPNVITVGALTNDGKPTKFTNFSTGDGEVTLAAAGEEVVSGYGLDGNPVYSTGTSFSTPQVAAAVAVLQSINPNLTAEDIKKVLVESGGRGVSVGNQSIPVPEKLGGRVLRLDNAVLQVINDLRKAKGQPPLAAETLEKLGSVDLAADSKNPKEYTLRASLGAVGEKGADVKIEMMGEGMLSGSSAKHLSAAGEATWGLTLIDEKNKPTIKVTRLDSGACATLSLVPMDVAGRWTGTMTVTDWKANRDIVVPGPGGEPLVDIKKEECEAQMKASAGKPQPITMEFQPQSPESGTVILLSSEKQEGEEEEQAGKEESEPMPYRLSGNSLTVDYQKGLDTTHWEGEISLEGKDLKLRGNLDLALGDSQGKAFEMKGSFDVSKPQQ